MKLYLIIIYTQTIFVALAEVNSIILFKSPIIPITINYSSKAQHRPHVVAQVTYNYINNGHMSIYYTIQSREWNTKIGE